jgi:predicted extracellular nuclease
MHITWPRDARSGPRGVVVGGANLLTGTTMTDLITTLPAGEHYSYVYDGNCQVLDHIATSSAFRAVACDVVHINSEFYDQAGDHDPQAVHLTM